MESNGVHSTRYDFQTSDSKFNSRRSGCCARRTKLEIVLIVALVVMAIIAIVLIILVAKKQADFEATNCDSPVCIEEASKVAQYVNPDVDPCDDFYEFACGNFLKEAHGDENLGLQPRLSAQAKRERLEAYAEPPDPKEHKVIGVAKQLFRACMNETKIRADDRKAIADALRSVGGWPVVEGAKWKDSKFDWLKITYKLRKMGYEYNIFLDLSVTSDPENPSRYLYKVSTPNMWDYSTNIYDKIELMTSLAEKFGAYEKKFTDEEIKQTHEYLLTLQREVHTRYNLANWRKYTLEEYQRKVKSINWLDFINNLIGPANNISSADFVLFPPPELMVSWLNIVSIVPKRTQANYMMWKLVELSLPYLPEKYKGQTGLRSRDSSSRENFCVSEIQKRLVPSPIDVLCDRKYLPKDKKRQVEDLLENVKSDLIDFVEGIRWLNASYKETLLSKTKSLKFVVGQPTDYFDEAIFDHLDVDLIASKSDSFLSLIAQANRNRQSTLYSLPKGDGVNILYEKFNYQVASTQLPLYLESENSLVVPLVATENLLFDENRSAYLNYGALGSQLTFILGSMLTYPYYTSSNLKWSQEVTHEIEQRKKCLQDVVESWKFNKYKDFAWILLLQHNVGQRLSRGAYKKWVAKHGEEKKLIGIRYSPDQLFWIASVTPFCSPANPVRTDEVAVSDYVPKLISGSVRNVPQFATDFKCPADANMNPSKRCPFI